MLKKRQERNDSVTTIRTRRDMERLETIKKKIAKKVHAFCDDVLRGNISDNVILRYKIPQTYLDVCRDTKHPSSVKLPKRLHNYLMMRVGIYDNIGDEEALKDIYAKLNDLLQTPQENDNQKTLFMPQFILGVKHALERIEKLNGTHDIEFPEKSKIDRVLFGKEKNSFQLSYIKNHRDSISLEDFTTPTTQIQIEGEGFEVPAGGGHLNSRKITFFQPDEVTIQIDKFHHCCLKDDRPYYFRYITEVKAKEDLVSIFEVGSYDIDGIDTHAICSLVDGNNLLLYYYCFNEKRYLIIEYAAAITVKEMNDLCFSTLVAFGMITADIHLDEYWLAAYDAPDKLVEIGLYYQSLVPSIHCNYLIFTTNVYPSLVHVAKRIDPVNGEHRACDIISNLKLSNALLELPCEVFGRLVENMRKYEDLQRGILIILLGSKQHLEIQAATYCVALEAIANVARNIIGDDIMVIIKDKGRWKSIRQEFAELNINLLEKGMIDVEEKVGMDKKINSMNNNFNNVVLRSLLDYYQYPITQFDDLTLHLRNVLLHGSIEIDKFKGRKQEDYLFELSMNLHKLCCAIALLMSGYNGYIINNRKLYGFDSSCKSFIKIGGNMRMKVK